MKKIFIALFVLPLFFSSCTVTNYSGDIYPNQVEFNKANFRYVKTIKGSASTKYNSYGWDKKKSDGLINEAKSNMYQNHNFSPNQVVTNITKDVLRITDTKGLGSREVKVIITGDIYEFSNNGVYSSEPQSNNYNQPEDDNQKSINQEKIISENPFLFNVGDIVYKGEGKEKKECKVIKVFSQDWVEVTYIRAEKERSQKIGVIWLYKKDANGVYYHP